MTTSSTILHATPRFSHGGDSSLFARLVQSCADGVIAQTLDGVVTAWNPAAQRILGFSAEEVIGRPLSQVMQDPLRSGEPDMLSRIGNGEPLPYREARLTGKDGRPVDVGLTTWPEVSDQGEVSGTVTMVRELAPNRAAGMNLIYRKIVEALPDSLNVKDTDGRFLVANEATAALMKARSAAELIGRTDFDFYPKEVAEAFLRDERKILADGLPTVLEQEATWRDGKTVFLSTLKVPLRDKTGAIAGLITLNRDITEQRLLEGQLKESEQRYSQVAEITQEAWWEEHLPSERVKNSRRFCMMLGLGEEMMDCALADFLDLIHPDDQQQVQAALDDAIDRNVDYAMDYRLRHADGHYIWVDDHGRVIERDPDGKPVRLLGAMTDITARKQTELALQESERNFRNLFDDAPDAYLILDPTDGRALACNHATMRILRGSREQIIGRSPDQVSPPLQPDGRPSKDAAAEQIREIMKSGYHRFEWMQRRFDGEDFWVEVTATVGTFQQRPVLFIIWREIGEILAAKQAAEAASVAKSQFLSVMSHEFRTPLAAIMGMFQLIDMAGVNEKIRDFAARGLNSAEHLLKLVEDILDFSSIEAGRLALVREPFRLGTLLEELENATSGKRKPDVGFVIDTDDAMRATEFSGDALRLKQVLINLLGNAFKFTDSGKVVVSVREVGGTAEVPVVEFVVEDTGIGLSPEQIDRLFQPFTQLDMRDTRRFGGSGLGLVISKRLVNLMGGEAISVTSQAGVGSRFSFQLALPRVVRTAERNVPDASAGKGARLAGYRVLVVEDSATIRFAVRLLLQSEGAIVEEAADGAEAVSMASAAAEPYDTILMDMHMPMLDGIEATRELRQRGYTQPILALTASAFGHDMQACLAAGMNDYIAKPVKIDTLVDVIKKNHSTPAA